MIKAKYIRYATTDPLTALKWAVERYGSDHSFILMPGILWSRFVPKNTSKAYPRHTNRQKEPEKPRQMGLFGEDKH